MRLSSALFVRWNPISVKYANLPDRYIKRAMEQVSRNIKIILRLDHVNIVTNRFVILKIFSRA